MEQLLLLGYMDGVAIMIMTKLLSVRLEMLMAMEGKTGLLATHLLIIRLGELL